jgi:glycosyltransferase involved in cell wall biosynthesis
VNQPGSSGEISVRPHELGVSPTKIQVSIIIPVLNEERYIRLCLDALCKLDFPQENFEVIVVDNGSTDQTLHIAKSFQGTLSVRILEKRGVYISALRNLGASVAVGQFLAFLDADCLAPRHWLKDATRFLRQAEYDVIGAHYQIPQDSSWVGRIWHEYREAGKLGEVSYLPAGDLLLSRDSFLQAGGFDEQLQTNEDFEFCQRALANNLKIWALPELRVIHLGTAQTLAHFFRKHRWHGKDVLRVFLNNLPQLHNVKPLLFSAYVLGWFLGVAAGFAAGVLSGKYVWFEIALLGPVIPLLIISLYSSIANGKIRDTVPLATLYVTYGLARGVCLLNFKALFGNGNKNESREPGLSLDFRGRRS